MNQEMEKFSRNFKFALGALVVIGLIMVYSASYIFASDKFGSSSHFFLRQFAFILVSLATCFFISKTKITFWLKYSYELNILATIMLFLTFIPGLGAVVKGANRWISLGGFTLQPGEIIKYTLMLSSLTFLDQYKSYTQKKLIWHVGSLIFPMILLINQPDFGTFSICFIVMGFVFFMMDFNRKYFYSAVGSGLIMLLVLLISRPYRVKRLMAYLDPWKNAQGSGFQIIQSWMGFANGGFFGTGPGNSIEKLFYLPEAHNDFIFSVIGEEFGFIGVSILIALFCTIVYYGFQMALHIKDKVGHTLVCTVTFMIGVQCLLNMGVVLGLLPTKGLNLPFISYGGSSLLSNFFGIGLIMSVLKQVREQEVYNSPASYTAGSQSQFNSSSSPIIGANRPTVGASRPSVGVNSNRLNSTRLPSSRLP